MPQSRPTHGELEFDRLAEIAVGATARVELCRVLDKTRKNQLMAVKRLHPHVAEDPAFLDMFRDEVWMSAALKHQHVAEVADWGEDADGPWLAVELVRGVSLQRLMKTVFETGEMFSERMVVYIGRCICDGLAEAHSLRSSEGVLLDLVHRDPSPGNILLSFAGEVKITDFGLAKAKQRLTRTLTGLLKGQPQYMSPEQVNGAPLDGRSDLFGLGVVLFELFSGRRPWKAATDLDAMRAITANPPESLLRLRPKIDKALVQIVERCLEKEPADRCDSATWLRDRLDRWLGAHGHKDGNPKALSRFVRRNAMRQMRWFERAVAGELAEQMAADPQVPLHTREHAVAAPSTVPPPPKRGAGRAPASPTRKGATRTRPTVADGPHGRLSGLREDRWAQSGPGSAQIDGEAEGPTNHGRLAKRPDLGDDERQARDDQTVVHQGKGCSAEKERPARRATGGSESRGNETATQKPAPLEDGRPEAAASTATVRRTSDQAAPTSDALGVVAPPDPHVPPLPGDQGVVGPVSARTDKALDVAVPSQVPLSDLDGADTATAIKPDAIRSAATRSAATRSAATGRDGDAPTIEAVVPSPTEALFDVVSRDQEGPASPSAPRFSSAPSPTERSGDFEVETRRLGDEAKQAAEAASCAAMLAEAAAQAATLAADASLLSAVGDQQGASERLLEAQLLDEALKRGEIPPMTSAAAASGNMSGDHQGWLARRIAPEGSRKGASVIVIVTIGLLAVVLLLAVLW